MKHSLLAILGASTLLLLGCGGSTPAASAPDSGPSPTVGASDSAPADDGSAPQGSETSEGASSADEGGSSSQAAEPAPPAPKTRIEQCQVLGSGMQQVQQVGPIANAGDSNKLRAMAQELRKEAEALSKPKLAHAELAALRDRYVETTNDMAAALEAAASSGVATEQKASVEKFRKLEPTLNDHIEKLNEICNK